MHHLALGWSALLAALLLDQVGRLARGDQDEQLPQVVAVLQLREAALLGGPAEAVEGVQGHVLLVGRPPRRGPEFGPRQADQPPEVALPQPLRGLALALLESPDPVADRSGLRHSSSPRARASGVRPLAQCPPPRLGSQAPASPGLGQARARAVS